MAFYPNDFGFPIVYHFKQYRLLCINNAANISDVCDPSCKDIKFVTKQLETLPNAS